MGELHRVWQGGHLYRSLIMPQHKLSKRGRGKPGLLPGHQQKHFQSSQSRSVADSIQPCWSCGVTLILLVRWATWSHPDIAGYAVKYCTQNIIISSNHVLIMKIITEELQRS